MICILGSSSFAGSTYERHLLESGIDVLSVSRRQRTSPAQLIFNDAQIRGKRIQVLFDINSELKDILAIFSKYKPSIIIDFMGQGMVEPSWSYPELWIQTNVSSKVKLIRNLCHVNWLEKYIRISTPEVFGYREKPLDTTDCFAPSTPYAVSHASMDMLLQAFHSHLNFPSIIARYANFYGPGQQLYRIVPKTIIHAKKGVRIPLHGGGKSERSFIFSSDIVSSLDCVISTGQPGSAYHFSGIESLKITELVQILAQLLHVRFSDLIEVSEDRLGKDLSYRLNSRPTEKALHWRSKVSLVEGLEQTLSWYIRFLPELINLSTEYKLEK